MTVSVYEFRSVNLKRFLIVIAVLLAAGGAVYALHKMQVDRNGRQMLLQAQNLKQLGNLNEAITLYQRYLNFQPRDTAVLAEYAEAMDEMVKSQPKRLRELFDLYERILSSDPSRNDDRRKLAERYLAIGRYARAGSHIETLMKRDPALANDPLLMAQFGLCAEKLGQIPEAVARYRTAIDTGKAPSDTYLRLATLLQTDAKSKTSLDESRKLLDRLVQDKPTDPAARMALARYFMALKQNGEAIKQLQAALNGNPAAAKSPEIVFTLADLLMAANDAPSARDVLRQAVAANPKEARFRIFYSDFLIRAGDKDAAQTQLRDAIELVQKDDELAVEVLDRMIERGDLLEARKEIQDRHRDKTSGYADYLFGKLALATGDWPDAQRRLQAALPAFAKNPKRLARTHEALGHCARLAGNPDRMAACFEAAVKADPTLETAKLALAETNAWLGRTGEAAETFRKFAERDLNARLRLAQLALAEQLGRPVEKRNWAAFEEAIGRPPRPAAFDALAIAALKLQGRGDEAIAVVKTQIEREPKAIAGYVTLAALQNATDAKATLDEAQEKLGDRVEIRLARANLLANQPKPDAEALADLEENAATFSPEHRYVLYFGLANVQTRRLHKPAAALPLLKKAADVKTNDLACRIALLDVLIELARFDDVETLIAELRNLDGADGPSHLYALVARDVARTKPLPPGKVAELRARIGAVLNARPTWGRAMLLAAELDDLAGDTEAALDKFRRAFALGERRPAAVQRLVSLLTSRRRFEDARRVLTEAEQTIPLTDDLRRQGNLLDAIVEKPGPQAEEFVANSAESKVAADQIFRGQWYLLHHKPKEAAAAYEKALQIEGTNAEAWLGLLLANAGDRKAGDAVWERMKAAIAAAKLPDPAAAPCLLGVGREALQDFAGAEKIYVEGLKSFPNHPDLTAQLALLYQRLGRPADAANGFRALLSTNAGDALKRKARRELAYAAVAGPNALSQVNAALELIAANQPPSPDDLRAKGIIVSLDPFRRVEARKLLETAASQAAPGQDDALRLADFYSRDLDSAKAEEVLRDATRGSAVIAPFMLQLLHRLQFELGKTAEAQQTLDRLAAVAPNSWDLAVEQARLMAARNEKSDAAKKLAAHPLVAEPAAKLRILLPVLTDIGCIAEAEDLLKNLVETTTLPQRHATRVVFLAGQGRGLDALRAAVALPDAEYPPSLKARLLAIALLPLPRESLQQFDRAAWDGLADEIAKWLEAAQSKVPNDAALVTLQGVLADARGQTELAIGHFEKAVAIDPKAETAVNSLAFLLAIGPKPDAARAEAIITKLIDQVGPKPALLDTRAAARILLGQTKEAQADVEAAIAQLPKKSVYYFRLAAVREKAGELDTRTIAFQKAKQLGLKKESLHPLEWPLYEKMAAAVTR